MTSIHALIIDDNEQNANVLAQLLNRQKVTSTNVVQVQRLDGVLDGLKNIDVIFLDLEMPGVDGYKVLSRLKGDNRFTSTPVVAYSVHVHEINNAHRQGFDGFLSKPLNATSFPDQLARILRGEKVWETL